MNKYKNIENFKNELISDDILQYTSNKFDPCYLETEKKMSDKFNNYQIYDVPINNKTGTFSSSFKDPYFKNFKNYDVDIESKLYHSNLTKKPLDKLAEKITTGKLIILPDDNCDNSLNYLTHNDKNEEENVIKNIYRSKKNPNCYNLPKREELLDDKSLPPYPGINTRNYNRKSNYFYKYKKQ